MLSNIIEICHGQSMTFLLDSKKRLTHFALNSKIAAWCIDLHRIMLNYLDLLS